MANIATINNPTEKKRLPVSARADLKTRLAIIMPELEQVKYMDMVCKAYPEYDNKQGREKIRNVKAGYCYDTKITEILERIAAATKNMPSII